MKKTVLSILLLVFAVGMGYAQSVIGVWKTIDDETGKEKSYVEIFEKDKKVYGKITKLLNRPANDQDPICDQCTDDRKNQKVLGMEIVRGLKKSGDTYEGGTITDPKNGKVYDCKAWIDKGKPDVLNVRGYIAFFYRTQTWHRVK